MQGSSAIALKSEGSSAIALKRVLKATFSFSSSPGASQTSPIVRDLTRAVLFLAFLALVPFWMPSYWLFVSLTSFVYGLAVLSVVVLFRATGSASLAQATFMGISAYACSWFFQHLGWPYLAAAIVSVILPVPIGVLLAFPALRLRGLEQLMVLTLTLGLAAQAILFNTNAPLQIGDGSGASLGATPSPLGLNLSDNKVMFWAALAVTAVVVLGIVALLAGPIGSTWKAIRAGNAVAAASGVRIARHQMLGFALSATVAGVAGVMLLTTQNEVTPGSFESGEAIFLVVIAVLAGIDRLRAAIVGGIFLGLFSQVLPTFNISANWIGVVSGFSVVIALPAVERLRSDWSPT